MLCYNFVNYYIHRVPTPQKERPEHMNYSVEDKGDHRLLIIGEKSYKTKYSKRIIDLIIERKGLTRAPEYFVHKDKRNKFLTPLFNYLKEKKTNGPSHPGGRLLDRAFH